MANYLLGSCRMAEIFAYRININWLIFFASGLVAVIITMTIIILKATNVSKINPVDVLKYE